MLTDMQQNIEFYTFIFNIQLYLTIKILFGKNANWAWECLNPYYCSLRDTRHSPPHA